jgi:hypothetical protein
MYSIQSEIFMWHQMTLHKYSLVTHVLYKHTNYEHLKVKIQLLSPLGIVDTW